MRKQASSTGYTNLISHLVTSTPVTPSPLEASQHAPGQTLEAHGFVDQRTMEIYKWIEWIIARNQTLSEADDPMTRS